MSYPMVSQQELLDFYAIHFSLECVDHFSECFLWPDETETNDDDDNLGYYSDGTKRTLTDEQIAIFRHSELQRIALAKQNLSETSENANETTNISGEPQNIPNVEAREKAKQNSAPPAKNSGKPLSNKARKAQKAKLKGYFRPNIKPDLRKRTWDKVDTGLENLDYDEFHGESGQESRPSAQRRKISYDDT